MNFFYLLGYVKLQNVLLCLGLIHNFLSDDSLCRTLEGYDELILSWVVAITQFDYETLLERLTTEVEVPVGFLIPLINQLLCPVVNFSLYYLYGR